MNGRGRLRAARDGNRTATFARSLMLLLVLWSPLSAGSAIAGETETAGAAESVAGPVVERTALGQEAERHFDEWRFRDGRLALAKLAKQAPGSAEELYVEGYARYLEGDYEGAVAKLGAAGHRAPADPTVKELRALAEAARDVVKDHKEARSKHFVMRYPSEDAVLVPYALEALESAYAALAADLGFEAEIPVRVEIYRSPADLAAVSSLSVAEVARTGTIALCKWARLMVTTPRALAYGYPWLDSMNHELVHYAVSALSADKAPVWLQEGLAKFLERRWREPAGGRLAPAMEHLLAKALRAGKLIGFDAMHPSMAKLPSAEDASLAFAEVATAVGYLHARAGMPALRAAIASVASGEDARAAVALAAGASWSEFERNWKSYMVDLKLRLHPGFDLPTTHIRKAGAIASGRKPTEDEALSALKLSAPFRHLRLGNMMLKRKRPRAAAVQYEKGADAMAAKPVAGPEGAPAQWLFPVKLGRTYLALGEPDRALKALSSVRVTYPDLPWPQLIAGQALLARGEPREAVVALRASLATNPFDPAVHCGLAEAYGKLPVNERPPGEQITREQQLCRELAE